MALKWGIVSAGKICHDFVSAIETFSTTDHQVVAIAARDFERAKEFARTHEIPMAYAGYEQLALDPNIEVVYVGVLNPQHLEVSMLMLQNGKHVLCEKPMCMNSRQTKELLAYAKEKQLFIMEGIWSRFLPSYQYLRKQIESRNLGEIKEVNIELGLMLADNDRMIKKSFGGGTILTLGVYSIQMAQWVFQEPPMTVNAIGTLNNEGCDLTMEAKLVYANNGIASIKMSALETLSNTAVIKGTKGEIKLENFVAATTLIDVDGTEKYWPLPQTKRKLHYIFSSGLRYEAEEVRKCIREKRLQSELLTHSEILVISQIEDELRKQIGVQFSVDD